MGFSNVQYPAQSGKETLFWAGRVDRLHDPIRSTRWRMCFGQDIFKAIGINYTVGNGTYGESPETTDDFTLHIIDGASVPSVKTKDQAINYMGFEKYYPVQQEGLASTMSLTGLLTEDARAYETILLWNQRCLNTGVLNGVGEGDSIGPEANRLEHVDDNGGTSLYLGLGQQENNSTLNSNQTYKVLRNSSVTLELYDWNFGRVIMGIRLINAWPKSVDVSTQLSYTSADLMKFKFELRYDRFNIWFNPNYRHMVG